MAKISGFLEFRHGSYVIVRVGHGTRKHGDDYEWGGVCSLAYGVATPQAVSTKPVTREAYNEIRRLLREAGLTFSYDRLSDTGSYQMVETLGPNGEIKMDKTKLQKIAANGPGNRFADDGLTAHSVHSGQAAGNKIDQKRGVEIAKAMLEALAAGEFELLSVDPSTYSDPAQLASLVALVDAGTATVTKNVTSQIAEQGQPMTKSLSITLSGAPIPSITIVYGLGHRA